MVYIKNFTLITLIDFSALINFILIIIISQLKLKTELKEELYSLSIINKELITEAKRLIYIETIKYNIALYTR